MIAPPLEVLLIEDNPGDVDLLRSYLSEGGNGGFDVVAAPQLATGLDHLGQVHFDVVLLDLGLPDSQGLGGLARIHHQVPTVPVIILTGQQEETLGLEALRQGAQDYLVKGQMTGPLLVRAIRYAVERARIGDQLRQKEAQLDALMEQAPAVVWMTDDRLRFTSALGGALLLGRDHRSADLIGQSLTDFFHTRDASFPLLLAHQKALKGERVLLDLDWQGRIYQVRMQPFHGPAGEVIGVLGAALDITEHRRVEIEFRAAHEIQQRLLPACLPFAPGLDIAGASHAARATGGDFFDYIVQADGSLLVAVGDASGHGFGPAILAAITHACLHVLAQAGVELPTMLAATNRRLHADTGGEQFVTLLLAQLQPAARTLVWSNAGHPFGYILDEAGRVKLQLESTGSFLGLFPEAVFPLAPAAGSPVNLAAGDLVLIVSDGILEARSPQGAIFGVEQTLAAVRARQEQSAQDIVTALCQAVRDHCQCTTPQDDVTVVVIKVKPAP